MSTGLDLEAVAAGLAKAVGDVAGIRQAYDHIPDRLPQVPAAYVDFADPVQYQRRFAVGAAEAEMPVVVIVGRAEEAQSQRLIRKLQSQMPLEDPGESHPSIGAAIAADRTLGDTCRTSLLTRSGDPRPIEVAGVAYLAATFHITVHT